MRVGDRVWIIHGKFRWKSGWLLAQPLCISNFGVGEQFETDSERWFVELGYGIVVEIWDYEIEVASDWQENDWNQY